MSLVRRNTSTCQYYQVNSQPVQMPGATLFEVSAMEATISGFTAQGSAARHTKRQCVQRLVNTVLYLKPDELVRGGVSQDIKVVHITIHCLEILQKYFPSQK